MLNTPTAIYGRTPIQPELQVRPITESQSTGYWGDDGFSFDDVLDVVNPLQHLPVVSDIYREITGDGINPGGKVAGGALYGGVVGLLSGFVSSTLEQITGSSAAQNVAALFNNTPYANTNIQVAANTNLVAENVDWSQPVDTGRARYDTAAFLERYRSAQYLGSSSGQRINVAV